MSTKKTEAAPPSAKAVEAAGGSITIGGKVYRIAQQLNRIQLRHSDGDTHGLKFLAAITHTSETKTTKKGEKTTVVKTVRALDLNNGNEVDYHIADQVESVLNKAFPNAGYVNKSFAIRKTGTEGKRAKNFEALEIAEG